MYSKIMNKKDLRMMYKADTGFWPLELYKPGFYGIYNWQELRYDYIKWLEDFFPRPQDLKFDWKRDAPYLIYIEWLEETIVEKIENVRSLINNVEKEDFNCVDDYYDDYYYEGNWPGSR